MRDCLRITQASACLLAAIVLLTGCRREPGTARQEGTTTPERSSAAAPATDQKQGQTLAYVPGAPAADPNGERPIGPEVTVRMTNSLKYVPEEVTIQVGQTVVWTNTSSMVHTVTADPALARDRSHVQLPEGAQPFDSGNIASGAVFRHTFDVPGQYVYFCIPHEAMGMVGRITVQEKR